MMGLQDARNKAKTRKLSGSASPAATPVAAPTAPVRAHRSRAVHTELADELQEKEHDLNMKVWRLKPALHGPQAGRKAQGGAAGPPPGLHRCARPSTEQAAWLASSPPLAQADRRRAAVAAGDLAELKRLLAELPPERRYIFDDIDDDIDDITLFFIACFYGHLEVVRYLAETAKIDAEAQSDTGVTSFHSACAGGHLEVVRYLVETVRVDTEKSNISDGLAGVHFACAEGQLAVVQYLFQTVKVGARAVAKRGTTALHAACQHGRLEVVRYLLETVQFSAEDVLNAQGYLIPDTISFVSRLDPMEEMVAEEYITPLHRACEGGHAEVVQYLIEVAKVNPETKCGPRAETPFAAACLRGNLDVVRYLLTAPVRVDASPANNRGLPPIYMACHRGQVRGSASICRGSNHTTSECGLAVFQLERS